MFQPFIFQGETYIFILRFLAPPLFLVRKHVRGFSNVFLVWAEASLRRCWRVSTNMYHELLGAGVKGVHQTGDFFEKKKPAPKKGRKFITEIQIVLMCGVMCCIGSSLGLVGTSRVF